MAPRTRPVAPAVRLPPDVAAEVQAGVEEAERGETIELTPAELKHLAETGELPERVEEWAGLVAPRGT